MKLPAISMRGHIRKDNTIDTYVVYWYKSTSKSISILNSQTFRCTALDGVGTTIVWNYAGMGGLCTTEAEGRAIVPVVDANDGSNLSAFKTSAGLDER